MDKKTTERIIKMLKEHLQRQEEWKLANDERNLQEEQARKLRAEAARPSTLNAYPATGNLVETLMGLLKKTEQLEARVAQLESGGAMAAANETV